jgi:hypothetical protein
LLPITTLSSMFRTIRVFSFRGPPSHHADSLLNGSAQIARQKITPGGNPTAAPAFYRHVIPVPQRALTRPQFTQSARFLICLQWADQETGRCGTALLRHWTASGRSMGSGQSIPGEEAS